MSSGSEKTLFASRLLSWLLAFSMFLLISSSLSLFEFTGNSFFRKSVFQYVWVSDSSVDSEPNSFGNTLDSSVRDSVSPNETSKDIAIQEVVSETSKPNERMKESDESETFKPNERMNESDKSRGNFCDKKKALLRVYMYDLPPEFHFGLLGWKPSTNEAWPSLSDQKLVPSYPGGLNLQHSTEYWLTLDLLASNTENVVRPCSAIRVQNSSEANVIFVPFFSSLSYNRHSKRHGSQKVGTDRLLQQNLVKFLKSTKEWKRRGGKDHLVLAHHPNSMLVARKKLGSCMLVLSDFGRYPREIANLEKDIIAPYKHMVRTIPAENSASFNERPTLIYFQGAIYRKDGGAIRQELYYLLKDEKDVHFTFGSVQANGIRDAGKGMASSKFCLNIAGDTPSSNRLFDAIATHCVPVIISDEIELPYEDVLDYSEFCIFVRGADAVKKGYLLNFLRGITQERWTKLWEKLKQVSGHFEYRFPSQPNDAVDMIWQTVARKKTSTQLNVHRKNRYNRS